MRHPAVARTTAQLPSQELAISEQRLADHPPNLHRFFALLGDKVVGSVSVHLRTNPRQAHLGGLGMGVHPDYWGMGIGTKLMETIVDLADNWLNLKRFELDVNTDNPAAIHLYKKFGFVEEGVRRYHMFGDGGWSHSMIMARIRN
jgi:putative acetyltransferase